MLTKITYNCNPDSLGDVTPEAFVDAFENEIRANPDYRDIAVNVTFNSGKSEVTEFGSDDWEADISHEDYFRDQFGSIVEKAFTACLS